MLCYAPRVRRNCELRRDFRRCRRKMLNRQGETPLLTEQIHAPPRQDVKWPG